MILGINFGKVSSYYVWLASVFPIFWWLRTKTEPPIYYMLAKPIEENAEFSEQKKEQVIVENNILQL